MIDTSNTKCDPNKHTRLVKPIAKLGYYQVHQTMMMLVFISSMSATSGDDTITQSFDITVTTNDLPIVTSTAILTGFEDAIYEYQFAALDSDITDTVILSAESIPNWLTFDSDSGFLTGTPLSSDTGNHTIELRATSGINNDVVTQLFTLATKALTIHQSLQVVKLQTQRKIHYMNIKSLQRTKMMKILHIH